MFIPIEASKWQCLVTQVLFLTLAVGIVVTTLLAVAIAGPAGPVATSPGLVVANMQKFGGSVWKSGISI